jgi:hypothetical protein
MSGAVLVNVYRVDQDTFEETFDRRCYLVDLFGDGENDAEYQDARYEIGQVGRAWIGGGAAQLFLVMS